ncbi:peptide deformylase [Candidatus Uhrbacteria bacterium CG10_big_fil_rev_8_21_14_0_10_41_26]|nr:MAG: peptide deformylase [Candidatus Uhrbacteria bacterium CG_4_10_14_3_um_filter_41_21]PJB84671.1 MAG: peptide deformylase [Candidatus Uhrbacteria bacterium CG_4_9_14_0_8_um_filter_41_16]PJE75146.1 MAG: peptide deformylase [Candidatus Uhrbacteria bacterium CG10_big_fil_rev_8_21_14_0_10_41_26]
MIFEVLTTPNPKLRERSREVLVNEIKTPEMQKFFDDLVETMKVEDGIGIAAPQVGNNIRVIIVLTKKGPEVFINPEITFRSIKKVKEEEGCLSVPGVYGIVERCKEVRVSALDRNGNKIQPDTKGFMSIIFQHEIDHLDGILFIDRAKKIKAEGTSRI